MIRGCKILLAMGLLSIAAIGCSSYSDQRPDPNQLSSGDSGLQSKDVIACTNQMVTDLLASPQLNASPTQWTLVVTNVQDLTTDRLWGTNYDIFIEALRAAIAQKAQGRIQLIENKQTFNDIRNSEVEGGNADPYQQGGNPNPGAPGAVNPDHFLYGKAIDMPNRSTNFYLLEFTIFDNHRMQVWTGTYEVKVARD
jgi:hypothetical protein